jgi:hypothetical protein
MSEVRQFGIVKKDRSLILKLRSSEIPVTKPSKFPEFVKGFFSPVIENFKEAFPTCQKGIIRKNVNFFWQTLAVSEDGQTDSEGTALNEAITEILANYARRGSSRKDKKSTIFRPNLEMIGPKATKIGKRLLKVLSINLPTQEVMNLLGEAALLGKVDQLKSAYDERKNDKDPGFDNFFQESSIATNSNNKLLTIFAQGSGGAIDGDERQVTLYAWLPIALFAFRANPSISFSVWEDVIPSLILLKSYQMVLYHEVTHALSNASHTDNGSFLGVKRSSKKADT